MKVIRRSLVLALAVVATAAYGTPASAQQNVLEVGDVAPNFTVPAATRYGVLAEPIQLSDFQGKTVVLAFFPRARTQGCTIQMHAYRDQYSELFRDGQDVILIAMSTDSAEDLHAWARDDQFQFVMASDQDSEVAGVYGASREDGRPFSNRFLYVIGPDGRIAHTQIPFLETDPSSYTALAEALDDVVEATAQD